MEQAKVTSKGQITIPKKIREKLNISPGDRIFFNMDESGNIKLQKSESSIKERAGSLKEYAPSEPVSVEEMNETIKQSAVERNERSK